MSNRTAKRAPIVRLPPKSNFELLLARGGQVSIIFMGLVALVFALHAGEYIFAPISLAIVIGLMLGPVASLLERRGMPAGLSAALVVVLFLILLCVFALALAAPLSFWVGRIPQIWSELQHQLSDWRQPLDAIRGARDEIRKITGGSGLAVSVNDGSPVESMATLAPAILAQVLLFFASLYFFVATRHRTRIAILALCFDRRLRWRVAHIFRDVEKFVSQYLLSITMINIVEGLAVGIGLYLIGVSSALLWGALAIITSFVIYIGPAIMTAILFAVGLAEFDYLGGALLPPLLYLAINAIEAQLVTPLVIGRTMTLNPFVVLLSLAFWIWLWGPLGGFIAIPALLIVFAMIRNFVPGTDFWVESTQR
jgi:predicted PurR-regulated permease PerM